MPRGEAFTTTVLRALHALGGEASTVEILRWVQDNRPALNFYWQKAVSDALADHSDGRGKALFEQTSEEPARWRIGNVPYWLQNSIQEPISAARRANDPADGTIGAMHGGRLARLLAQAMADPGFAADDPLEQYLFGLLMYELGEYRAATGFFERALTGDLTGDRQGNAQRMLKACLLRLEA